MRSVTMAGAVVVMMAAAVMPANARLEDVRDRRDRRDREDVTARECRMKLDRQRDRVRQLSATVADLQVENDRLSTRVSNLRSRKMTLKNKVQDLRTENDRLSTRVESLRSENVRLDNRVQDLKRDLSRCESRGDSYGEVQELKRMNRELREEVTRLRKKLRDLGHGKEPTRANIISACSEAMQDTYFTDSCITMALENKVRPAVIKACGSVMDTDYFRESCVKSVAESRGRITVREVKACGESSSSDYSRAECVQRLAQN